MIRQPGDGPGGLTLSPNHNLDEEAAMKIARPLAAVGCTAVAVALAWPISPMSRGQSGPPPGRGGGISPVQVRNEVDQIVKDLREARTLAERIGDKAVREKMELILSRAELRARDLSDDLARARPAPAQPSGPAALTAPEFEKLLKGLKQEAFDDGKLTYLENFATARPLTCEQAATLLKNFSFDQGRVKATKLLYPKLVDKQNFNDVLNVFVFPNYKAEARTAVGLK
jgi:hypothetical protein